MDKNWLKTQQRRLAKHNDSKSHKPHNQHFSPLNILRSYKRSVVQICK